ncbi:MAG TPA: PrsW family glutamic-type intramembrane protease [Sphingomicrobium sp.]|nr:PrsW family glutamic-type intramembrane protease [Sphingomicrobium sp.]
MAGIAQDHVTVAAFLTEAAHWGFALVPVLVLLAIFVWLDAFELMSFREILLLLLLGGVAAIAAYPVSGRLIDTLPLGFSGYSRFVAPWIEEALKGAAMVGLFWFNRIGYKLDAVISGFAIGAGFSVVENIIYLSIFPEYGTGTWLVRGLGTAVMHGTTLAILAAIAHELAERETRESAGEFKFNLLWFLPGYFVAVALHMAFNQFPDRPMLAMMGAIIVAPIAIIAVFHFGTAEAERWLAAECAEHQAQLDALKAGSWPDSPSGRKVAALADRLGPEATKRARRYWELQAWLVVQAEETMMEEASGDVSLDAAEVKAAFAELAGLKRALGKSSFTALKALLPFSRNDYWEVSELRQRVAR